MREKGLREAATPIDMQLDLFKGLMDKHKGVEDELDFVDSLRVALIAVNLKIPSAIYTVF